MIKPNMLQKFYATAWERHRIYVMKELGLRKPWTDDPIFLDNYFCNVFRHLDKTSDWIVRIVIDPRADDPDLWKAIIMCRYISKIETLSQLVIEGIITQPVEVAKYLRLMKLRGETIFTNAFIVNSKTSTGFTDKITYLYRLIGEIEKKAALTPAGSADARFKSMQTLQQMFEFLYGLPGVGPFMAYQYTMDFSYSDRYLRMATDREDWTVLGLGAIRGLNRLLGQAPVSRGVGHDELVLSRQVYYDWQDEIEKNLEYEVERTERRIEMKHTEAYVDRDVIREYFIHFTRLQMSDVEHWFCEFDKYMRGGSKKRSYNGRI
jgi:hypothetical protein